MQGLAPGAIGGIRQPRKSPFEVLSKYIRGLINILVIHVRKINIADRPLNHLYLGYGPGLSGLVKLQVEVGGPEVVLLASGLLVPCAAPVLVGGRIRLCVLDEVLLVDSGNVEHLVSVLIIGLS